LEAPGKRTLRGHLLKCLSKLRGTLALAD
jgi:hypothetical protein